MPTIVPITDPDDPRVADYRDVRERDLVGREGRFIAEGTVVLRSLLGGSPHETLSLLVAEKRVDALMPLIERLPDELPVYSASQAVLDGVAGFPLHRGVLALGRRAAPPDPAALLAGLAPGAVILVLCGIGNHDNVGGIFRNAAAFGAAAVLLDSGCCDPLYRKAIRVSVGATLLVPFVQLPRDIDLVALLEGAGVISIALSPSGAVTLAELRRPQRTAVLLGSEGPGLPPALMARTRTARIPMAGDFDSLNVATTSGIVLHHLAFVAAPEPAR